MGRHGRLGRAESPTAGGGFRPSAFFLIQRRSQGTTRRRPCWRSSAQQQEVGGVDPARSALLFEQGLRDEFRQDEGGVEGLVEAAVPPELEAEHRQVLDR